MRCITVLVSRGNADGVERGRRRPAHGGINSPEKENGNGREAERPTRCRSLATSGDRTIQQAAGARNKLSPGGKKVEKRLNFAVSKQEPLMSRGLRKIQRSERDSGSLCSAAARDTQRVRARGEARRRPGNETRDESAREMKVEGPRPEANGSRSEAETIGETLRFSSGPSGFTIHYIYICTRYSHATDARSVPHSLGTRSRCKCWKKQR